MTKYLEYENHTLYQKGDRFTLDGQLCEVIATREGFLCDVEYKVIDDEGENMKIKPMKVFIEMNDGSAVQIEMPIKLDDMKLKFNARLFNNVLSTINKDDILSVSINEDILYNKRQDEGLHHNSTSTCRWYERKVVREFLKRIENLGSIPLSLSGSVTLYSASSNNLYTSEHGEFEMLKVLIESLYEMDLAEFMRSREKEYLMNEDFSMYREA